MLLLIFDKEKSIKINEKDWDMFLEMEQLKKIGIKRVSPRLSEYIDSWDMCKGLHKYD